MSATFFNLGLALLLLVTNAFYVASEFALVKSKNFRIEALAEEGRFGAKLSQHILANLEAYLACCQLGITMASLGLGWVGEPTVSAILLPLLLPLGFPESAVHLTAFISGFLIFSSLHIVVGEQVPKTLAIREPEPVSLWIAYPLHASFILLYPLNWLLNNASRAILGVLGVKEAPHQEILTDVEIEGLVEVSAEHGKMEESQAEYIQNMFRLSGLAVSDVMIHRKNMVTVDATLPAAEMLREVLDANHTRVPLWRDQPDNIVGVVHTKDIVRAIIEHGRAGVDVAALASPPWFVPDTTTLEEQISAFRERRSHFAFVVDEYGALQGLITLGDILDEILGAIPDEHEEEGRPDIRRRPDGSFLIDGSVPVRDINRELDWNLPDEEATTLAGLVIHEARTIPEVGQRFAFFGYQFEILKRQRNQVTALRVIAPATAAPTDAPVSAPAKPQRA